MVSGADSPGSHSPCLCVPGFGSSHCPALSRSEVKKALWWQIASANAADKRLRGQRLLRLRQQHEQLLDVARSGQPFVEYHSM